MPVNLPRIIPAVVAVLLAVSVTTARADFVATATLTGGSEVPPNASTASGLATITYEALNNDILYTVTFSGLSTPATASHIHLGAAGTNGPVILPFTSPGPPAATAGTFSGTLTNASIINSGATGLTTVAQIAAQIQAGNTYVNIHDAEFPGGEIRGQLGVVPEPASIALMALGLVGVGGHAWRQRRRA